MRLLFECGRLQPMTLFGDVGPRRPGSSVRPPTTHLETYLLGVALQAVTEHRYMLIQLRLVSLGLPYTEIWLTSRASSVRMPFFYQL